MPQESVVEQIVKSSNTWLNLVEALADFQPFSLQRFFYERALKYDATGKTCDTVNY
jgi:hypothetical protein